MAPRSPRPAILCLHGRGTSAEIFALQTARLRRLLDDSFEFVFVDAPFETPAGPGVLPVFEGRGPFYAWKWTTGIGGNAMVETTATIDEAIKTQIRITGEAFVGVMGFSQGGTLAAGILLRQQAGLTKKSDLTHGAFRFGVCLMSSCPPLLIGGEDPDQLDPIQLPTLHVVGKRDKIALMSRDMCCRYCDPLQSSMVEVDAAHHLPSSPGDILKIADAIRRLHRATST